MIFFSITFFGLKSELHHMLGIEPLISESFRVFFRYKFIFIFVFENDDLHSQTNNYYLRKVKDHNFDETFTDGKNMMENPSVQVFSCLS